MKRLPVFCVAMLVFACMRAVPASAELRVCDQTSFVLYAAVGYESGVQMLTRGWTRILPGGCAVALEGPLNQTQYFLYARSSRAHAGSALAWGGHIRLCGKDSNFAIDVPVGADRCGSDDAYLIPFAPVSTGHKASWTTTLTGSHRFANPGAARNAGVARLLGDIGYKVEPGGAASAQALADFRTHMRLAANVSDPDLFDALETEALKTAAPAGYSICNDGQAEIWAAIALRSKRASVVRGWWDVPSGACARVLTTPLAADNVYLLSQKHGNDKLVGGPTAFCVSNASFEIYGNAPCTTPGYSTVGFAATDTKGRTGYVAHVGNNGLLPPAPKWTQAASAGK
ncbi:MAG TPA: DUF1036 domain-containing protein [Rhizomicrobium sp.]|jgi:uncharacterized membrane protein